MVVRGLGWFVSLPSAGGKGHAAGRDLREESVVPAVVGDSLPGRVVDALVPDFEMLGRGAAVSRLPGVWFETRMFPGVDASVGYEGPRVHVEPVDSTCLSSSFGWVLRRLATVEGRRREVGRTPLGSWPTRRTGRVAGT